MKKLFTFLLLTLSALLFAATAEYRVLTLGDIHFEDISYHGTPGIKHRTRYSQQYADMWKKAMPEIFTTSAKLLDKDVPFIIQLGDFTQGYLSVKNSGKRCSLIHSTQSNPTTPTTSCSFPKATMTSKLSVPK